MAKKTTEGRLTSLVKVAGELQSLCDFEPPIKTKGKNEKELEALIIEAGSSLEPDDKLSALAQKTLKELGVTIGEAAEEEEEEEEEEVETTPEAEEVEEEETEEEEEEEEVPAPKKGKKGASSKVKAEEAVEVEDETEETEEEEEATEEVEEETEEDNSKKAMKTKTKTKTAPAKKAAAPAKVAPKKTAAPAPAKKAAAKEKKDRDLTKLGTTVGSQGGKIDDTLLANKGKWVTADQISKATKASTSRVNAHVIFLNKEGRGTIEVKKDGKLVSFKLVKVGA